MPLFGDGILAQMERLTRTQCSMNRLIKMVCRGDPKVLELEGMGVFMPLMKIRNSLIETRGNYKFNY